MENQAKMQVKLIDFAQQPLEKLYAAFRTCYSSDTPIEVWDKIKSEKITHEKIREFIGERFDMPLPIFDLRAAFDVVRNLCGQNKALRLSVVPRHYA